MRGGAIIVAALAAILAGGPALAQTGVPGLAGGPAMAQTGVLGPADLDAGNATRVFAEANALYAEGRYDEAASLYDRLVAAGYSLADVHYNLGNTHYKRGKIGRAVLEYERALAVAPDHDDALANLAFVREQLADRQAPLEGGILGALLDRIYARVTPSSFAILASAAYFALVGVLIAAVLRRGTAWTARAAFVLTAVAVLATAAAGVKAYRARALREAIVLADEVAVRTGPGDDFVLEFRLHEGTKVRIREERDGWRRTAVGGTDLEGWVPAAALEEIVPSERRTP